MTSGPVHQQNYSMFTVLRLIRRLAAQVSALGQVSGGALRRCTKDVNSAGCVQGFRVFSKKLLPCLRSCSRHAQGCLLNRLEKVRGPLFCSPGSSMRGAHTDTFLCTAQALVGVWGRWQSFPLEAPPQLQLTNHAHRPESQCACQDCTSLLRGSQGERRFMYNSASCAMQQKARTVQPLNRVTA